MHIWVVDLYGHIPCWLADEEFPLSNPKSLSSISLPSRQGELFLRLGSELALLLVARGDSVALTVLLFAAPDLTLYIEEAGMFITSGRRLPWTLCLISCVRKTQRQISNCYTIKKNCAQLSMYTCMLYVQMNKPPINIIQYNKLHTPIKCEVDMISKGMKGFEY